MYENARKYGLYQPHAAIFEALEYLCKKTGTCKISYEKLGEFARVRKKTTERAVRELISKGFILLDKAGYKMGQNDPMVGQNDPKSKEERTKEENIKEKKSKSVIKMTSSDKGRTDGLSSFDSFWKKYNPQMQYYNRKKACFEYWNNPKKMPEEWKKLAIEKADCHLPETNPYFWLTEETFLKLDIIRQIKDNQADKRKTRKSDQTPQNGEDIWLSPEQQFECLQKGIALAVVYNPETDSYPTTTLQIATERGLKIHRKILC